MWVDVVWCRAARARRMESLRDDRSRGRARHRELESGSMRQSTGMKCYGRTAGLEGFLPPRHIYLKLLTTLCTSRCICALTTLRRGYYEKFQARALIYFLAIFELIKNWDSGFYTSFDNPQYIANGLGGDKPKMYTEVCSTNWADTYLDPDSY